MTGRVEPRTISERVWISNGDRCFERTLAVTDVRLRVQVRSNSYDFQSYGKVERWDGERWQTVVGVDGPALKCWDRTRYPHKPTAHDFEPDVDHMIKEAFDVLRIDGDDDAR